MDTDELIEAFLERPNPTTSYNYSECLKDYAKFRRKTVTSAIAELLRAGYKIANGHVGRYAARMVGKRNKRGKITSGRGLSPSTVNLRLVVLRSLLKKARKAGLVTWEIDVAGQKPEDAKDNRGPSKGTLKAMLAAARALPSPEGERAYAILRIFGEVGLRKRELIGLDLADFDADGGTVAILAKGKTQQENVPISPECVEGIRRWLKVRPQPKEGSALFTNLIPGRYGRISAPAVYLIIRGLSDPVVNPMGTLRARVKRVGPHKIRHTAFTIGAENAKAAGMSREELQKFTRHKDSRSMSRYIDAADDVAKKLADANAASLDE